MKKGQFKISADLLFDPSLENTLYAVFTRFILVWIDVRNSIYTYYGFSYLFEDTDILNWDNVPQYDCVVTNLTEGGFNIQFNKI